MNGQPGPEVRWRQLHDCQNCHHGGSGYLCVMTRWHSGENRSEVRNIGYNDVHRNCRADGTTLGSTYGRHCLPWGCLTKPSRETRHLRLLRGRDAYVRWPRRPHVQTTHEDTNYTAPQWATSHGSSANMDGQKTLGSKRHYSKADCGRPSVDFRPNAGASSSNECLRR